MAVFVAAVVLGVAINAITLLRKDLDLENTTQQLSSRLRLAQQEAQFEQAEYAFGVESFGYVFYKRDAIDEAWQRITNDTLFPQQKLPHYKDLQITVDGKLAQLEQGEPQIILHPDYAQTFSLQFIDDHDREYTISANENGEITWVAVAD